MKSFKIAMTAGPGALVLVLVLLLAGGCGGEGSAGDVTEGALTPEDVVLGARDVATVTRGTLEQGVTLTGSLEPYLQVEVKAQIGGTLTRLGADRGDAVAEGDVLAVIDAEGVRSQAASAQAAVASAKAALALAERQRDSAKTLYDAGAMSEIEYEQARTAYEAAKAQVAAAEAAATSTAEQAQRTTVRAPFGGVVSDRKVETGEAVTSGAALFTLVNTSRLELHGQVPVAQAVHLKVGQQVVFTLDSFPGQTYRGAVVRIEPTADPGTRQIGLYLRMPNPGGLVGGLFATGRVLAGSLDDALLVPMAALRGQQGSRYVFFVDDGQIVQRPVTVVGRDDARGVAGIAGDVQAGDVVVVSPGMDITPGTAVQLTPEARAVAVPNADSMEVN